jgi:ABC-type transport system involved in multi-copper enzyme maturation permease subunit
MSSFLRSCRSWLQHNLSWSNSRQSWQERGGIAGLFLAAVLAVWLADRMTLATQVSVWALLLVAFAVLMRRGWIKLFGPVLFYDMLCVGRRSRYILFRLLYVIGLVLLLGCVYLGMYLDYRNVGGIPAQRMAQFAENFFFVFMLVQLVLVLILTPAYVAGCIAEEKDRKTLEFLLATDLRNREIVLSKLVSRLANLTLIVLAGLPILSALQFVGGVDPDLLLASFAALGLTMMSLASVSILLSVTSRRPRDAIIFAYFIILLYPTLAGITFGLHKMLSWLITQRELSEVIFGPVADTLRFLSQILNAGNLGYALIIVGDSMKRGNLGDVLPDLLRDYALFHGTVTILCAAWAVLRLRAIALRETEVKRKAKMVSRPAVSDAPMLWKEIWAEPRMRMGWFARILVGLLVGSSFLPVAIIWYEYVTEPRPWRAHWISEAMNVWVRAVGTPVCCLLLLAVAVRASTTVSGERDKQTLDALLTSPLDTGTILFSKWAGSILSVRWGWLWIGAVWFLGLITGGLNPCALPLLLASWLIYAGMFAVVGLWFSVVSQTSLRATVWTLVSVLMMGGGHWLLWITCCLPCVFLGRSNDLVEHIVKFQWGQTPPLVLAIAAFRTDDIKHIDRHESEVVFFSIIGLVLWIAGTIVLFNATNLRFRTLTAREPKRPVRPSPAPVVIDNWSPPPNPTSSDQFRPSSES